MLGAHQKMFVYESEVTQFGFCPLVLRSELIGRLISGASG